MDYEIADAIRRDVLDNNPPLEASRKLGELFSTMEGFWMALHNRPIADGVVIGNPGPDASVMSERYQTGVGNAASRYVQGMQAPRRDPKQAALRAAGKYRQRTTEAIQRGAYEAGIQSYDVAEAVQTAISDGGQAYVSGAQRRAAKVQRAFTKLAPLLAGVSQAVQSMPQDTDQQREARLLQARKLMLQVGRQYKGTSG